MKTIRAEDWWSEPQGFTGIVEYPDGTVEYWINGEKTYKEAVEVYRAWFPDSP